jgi:hypothetical protein
MSERPLQVDPVFEVVVDAPWFLPTEVEGFLKWLRRSGVPGENDGEKVRTFATYPAATKMPASLATDLRAHGLL